MGRLRFSIAGLMGLVLGVSVGIAALRFPSDQVAGAILLLSLVAFSLAVLAVVYRRGQGRAFWLGFALFGWGYMILTSGTWWDRGSMRPTLITSLVLEQASPYFLSTGNRTVKTSFFAHLFGADPRTQTVLTMLDEPVSMQFMNETPLEDVLRYIKSATTGPKSNGLPIYVDPAGLADAKKNMTSTITLEVEGVPLATTLRLLLDQLGLTYFVRDGLLMITSKAIAAPDPFHRIGHCFWALLLACFGGFAGRILYNTNPRDANPAA